MHFFFGGWSRDRIFYKWVFPVSDHSDTAFIIIYIFMQIGEWHAGGECAWYEGNRLSMSMGQKNKSSDLINHCSYFIRTESVILCKYYARSTLPDLKQDVQT